MTTDKDDYVLGELIGEGAYGAVFVCFDRKYEEKFAVKKIYLHKLNPKERDSAEEEAKLLRNLKHRHILHAESVFQDHGVLCIVTEFCDKGDLAQFLAKRNGNLLEELQILALFKQICSALEYLHGENILHRDIKTQNIFLTDEEMTVKLGDFGLAKVLEKPNQKAKTFCGTPYYMSPEIYDNKPYDSKSDIWAFGVCAYEMTTLELPFNAEKMRQLVDKIQEGQLPSMAKYQYSPQLIDMIKSMMCRNSDRRPTAKELLQNANALFEIGYEKLPYTYFWRSTSVFSQWYKTRFEVDGIKYMCAEQYMMQQKAMLMSDAERAEIIMALDEPCEINEQGEAVRNFFFYDWAEECRKVVEKGNMAKFSQNEQLKKKLFRTFPKTLVMACPHDTLLGIGLSKEDSRAWNEKTWRGRNLLGASLTKVRDILMAVHLKKALSERSDLIWELTESRRKEEKFRDWKYLIQLDKLLECKCQEIVEYGNMTKFLQKEDFEKQLFSTLPKTLVDAILEIELYKKDKRAQNRPTWTGNDDTLAAVMDTLNRLRELFHETVLGVQIEFR